MLSVAFGDGSGEFAFGVVAVAKPDRSPVVDDQDRGGVDRAGGVVELGEVGVESPGAPLSTLCWGAQLDLRPVTSSAARQVENDAGEITDSALAGYIAKYATKGTGATHGADRPIRDIAHVAHLDLTPHHRAMIETAWTLGELPEYEALNLHRWAHMLGFRGHFLTKSQRYSITFRTIRHERRIWRLREDLDALDTDPNGCPIDLDTVVVINDWVPVRFGHRDDAERELTAAIAERNRQHRRTPTAGSPT